MLYAGVTYSMTKYMASVIWNLFIICCKDSDLETILNRFEMILHGSMS